jgi:hypothetical protein
VAPTLTSTTGSYTATVDYTITNVLPDAGADVKTQSVPIDVVIKPCQLTELALTTSPSTFTLNPEAIQITTSVV